MNAFRIQTPSDGPSVKKAMILNSLIAGSILLPIIAGLVLHFELRNINKLVAAKSRAGTELICLLSIDALIAEDRPMLETVVSGLKSLNNGLTSVQLINQQGDEMASWTMKGAEEQKTVATVQPITLHGYQFGTAKMSWSYKHFAAPIVANVLKNCAVILIAGVILIFCTITFAQNTFVRPIEYLDEKVRAIAIHSTPPELDFKIRTREFINLNRSLDATSVILADKAENEALVFRAQEQARSAKEAAKAKMDFLSLMSHEIRTPLGVIMGFAKLLATSDLTQEEEEFVENINQSSEFLLQIVNDILDLSKIEAHGLQLDPAPMSISALCCEMENMMTPMVVNRGLTLKTNYEDLKNLQFIGDQHRLKQVLMNLIGNAVKFTEQGEITLNVRELGSETSDDGDEVKLVRFEVVDTGVGMTEETQSKIFNPFAQADNSICRKYGGTGLGLTISSQLVKMMGGNISVKSQLNEGSVFTFDIQMPVTESVLEDDILSPDPLGQETGPFDPSSLRILVVEDERMNRVLIEKVFRKIGYEVSFAEDGQVCVDRLKSGEIFDAIFVDLHLPHIGGLEIAEQIRSGIFGEEIAKVKLAIMSADIFGAEKGNEIGVDAFISKPVDFRELEQFLNTVHSPPAPVAETPLLKEYRGNTTELANPKKNRLNVLVVEDQELNQNLIGKIFKIFGVSPAYANDGLQCLEYLTNNSTIDAILLDLRMPNMDGFTVARKIRNGEAGTAYQQIPIAVISAEILAEQECHEMGIEDFIPKPLDINLLRGFVEKVEKENFIALAG